jgi:hypothetical protein
MRYPPDPRSAPPPTIYGQNWNFVSLVTDVANRRRVYSNSRDKQILPVGAWGGSKIIAGAKRYSAQPPE